VTIAATVSFLMTGILCGTECPPVFIDERWAWESTAHHGETHVFQPKQLLAAFVFFFQ
jgi:hypothetical protein